MTDREKILLLLFGELRDATVCAEIKLNATPADWGKLLADFDTHPEQTLLRMAARLRELVAQL
jgi:hypothetical protein